MLIIKDVLVSEEVVKEQFVCKLDACKGACCWEGDFGAPLEAAELDILETIFDKIKPYLSPEGLKAIDEEGLYTYYEDNKGYGTPLIDGGACAYLTYDQKGVAKCGIEVAYENGATDFKKPISCHLYPVRIKEIPSQGFYAMNYDRWDICSAACSLGKQLNVPVFKFVKEAIIRKYGQDFYNELEAAAGFLEEEE
jgi:hypothetical protein